jgi:3D (Asp-Asp-Asp) domain-containing protein
MNSDLRGERFLSNRLHPLMLVGVYLCAASAVSWSAYSAKRSQVGPALAALSSQPIRSVSQASPTLAVAPELAPELQLGVEPQVAELSEDGPVSEEVRYFNGRAVRPAKTFWMTVTAYSPDERSCGKWADGITASNKSVWSNAMQMVAADTRILPFGSLLTIEGYANDQIVPVEDRGGAIKGMRLDLLYPTHEDALQWGVKRMPVTVWEYVD